MVVGCREVRLVNVRASNDNVELVDCDVFNETFPQNKNQVWVLIPENKE